MYRVSGNQMNAREFDKYLQRDKHCPCCGSSGPDLIPNHRANRGMGGSKERDVPSNIHVLCSRTNGRIESDASEAARARAYGWKLYSWEEPDQMPYYDTVTGEWWLLDDEYSRRPATPEEVSRLVAGGVAI